MSMGFFSWVKIEMARCHLGFIIALGIDNLLWPFLGIQIYQSFLGPQWKILIVEPFVQSLFNVIPTAFLVNISDP